jgi:hypothetical protein
MSVDVQEVRNQLFDMEDPVDLVCSCFEVINTLVENQQDLDPIWEKSTKT